VHMSFPSPLALVLCFMGGLFHHQHSNRIFEAMNVTITRRLIAYSSGVRSIDGSSGFLHKEPELFRAWKSRREGGERRVVCEIVDIRQQAKPVSLPVATGNMATSATVHFHGLDGQPSMPVQRNAFR